MNLHLSLRAPSLTALLALALSSAVPAQSNWVDFTDDTATRLQLSTVSVTDSQEKDITSGDFDHNGFTDIVIVRKVPFSVPGGQANVLLMNENGVLTDRTTDLIPAFLTADDARDILAFDCNGDGWLDLVNANTFNDPPRLFINQGALGGIWQGFTEKLNWFSPQFIPGPQFCAVYDGDIDNDGDMDLYFSDYNNALEDRLLINDGSGQFTDETAVRFPTGINSSVFGTASFICDFNMDGWNDILKVSGSFEPMKLLINNGTGVFTQSQTLDSTTVYMCRTADFNNDGRRDFYVVSDGQDYVLRNDSTNVNGTINTTKISVIQSAKTNGFGGNVHVADLDRDGFDDVGVADVDVDIPGCTRRFSALRNRMPATASFLDPNNPVNMPWNSQGVHDFAWIDINNDGFMDMFQGLCTGYKVLMMDPFAIAAPFGSSCDASSISNTPGGGPPLLGNSNFTVQLDQAIPGVTPILLASLAQVTLPIGTAPCELLVQFPANLLRFGPVTDGTGHSQLNLPIPNSPLLEGARIFMQWLIPQAGGPINGQWSLSNGLDVFASSNDL